MTRMRGGLSLNVSIWTRISARGVYHFDTTRPAATNSLARFLAHSIHGKQTDSGPTNLTCARSITASE